MNMICPICGKEISYLWLYKDVEANVAYKVSRNEMKENSIDVYYERDVSAETPCCRKVLDIDEDEVKELIRGKSLLIPIENIPEPILMDDSYHYCIEYNGKLYLAVEYFASLRTAYTWDDKEIGDLMIFREAQENKINTLKLKRLKQIAKKINDEDLIMKEVEEK